jgi:hypothetical protein
VDAVLPGHVERNNHHAGLRDDYALQLARDERNTLLRLEELEERVLPANSTRASAPGLTRSAAQQLMRFCIIPSGLTGGGTQRPKSFARAS